MVSKKLKFNKKIATIILIVLIIGIFLSLNFTKSQVINNDEELEPNTDLIYYINVTYDGKDKNATNSSDNQLSHVYSEEIYVEDILPSDLTFQEFVLTSSGTIGAIERGTGNGCLGHVIDDSSILPSSSNFINTRGLHYDKETRKVSFTVKGIQAGCELTVGVKTKTPESVDDKTTEEIEVRRDIYNTAQAKEKKQVVISNTTHSYMGLSEEYVKMYNVKYEYDKEYPLAPDLPDTRKYIEGAKVTIPTTPMIDGYIFTGWKSSGITIINGTFKMPSNDVTLVGSFEKIKDYTVTYRIEGDTPSNYEVPNVKSYFVGNTVKVDSTKVGYIYNGYKFLGWEIEGIELSKDNTFKMPERNVVIVGKFEKLKYNVIYEFSSTIKPDNADSLLPVSKKYSAGEKVKLEKVSDVPGFKFMGWLYDNEFTMPDHDVTIQGEWSKVNGLFSPSISIRDITNKGYYHKGDIVNLEITVTNNESYPIRDVYVKQNSNLVLLSGNNYTLRNENVAVINSIEAKSSVKVNARYTVNTDDAKVRNEVEITSALADNDYLFNKSNNSKASIEISTSSRLEICNKVKNGTGVENFGFHITGKNYETWISSKTSECITVYVNPGKYTVKEIVPQEFTLDQNNQVVNINLGEKKTVNFNNTYNKHNFYHSVKWLYKKIRGGGN